ncbi:Imm7 family immunity protein [Psychrobacter sp.]|uniref:Imm7 family immunity protein n=1 Tax=Psychrobacter sp. TaxID=56811 RepID=UPI003BB1C612
MIEYQGWFVIRESFSELDESKDKMKEVWQKLEFFVANINCNRNICQMKITNGSYKLMIAGMDNHKSYSWTEILEFLNWIAIEAKGSYGLLYFCDDEDKDGLDNQFQVIVLKKGKISFELDKFLSPYNPEVEE